VGHSIDTPSPTASIRQACTRAARRVHQPSLAEQNIQIGQSFMKNGFPFLLTEINCNSVRGIWRGAGITLPLSALENMPSAVPMAQAEF